MPKYWMISDRLVDRGKQIFCSERGPLSFWVSDGGALNQFASWKEILRVEDFKSQLLAQVATLAPVVASGTHEDQKHVALFVHGYNDTWLAEAARYQIICDGLFSGPDSMGICVWFDWPSKGEALAYLPDRQDARECAPDLADVLDEFYEWLLQQERAAAKDPAKACQVKTSIIAHSMGNFLLQLAMYQLWLRKNQPLLVSLVNQLLMVAADVDNDLFKSGDTVRNDDGDGIANLSYRVTALYSGLDSVLGASAGLKHFGKRRLGRSGLDATCPIPDNVWDVDCTPMLPGGAGFKNTWAVHGIYFTNADIILLMRQILRGVDRGILATRGLAPV